MHLLNGLYDAKIDGAPVLAITGMTYHDLIGAHYLQDTNQDYLYQDVAIYNRRIMGPAHVENVMNLAWRTALSNSGISHVAIPIDIQAMAASQEKRFKRNVKGHTSSAYQPADRLLRARRLVRLRGRAPSDLDADRRAGAAAKSARNRAGHHRDRRRLQLSPPDPGWNGPLAMHPAEVIALALDAREAVPHIHPE